MDTSSCLPLLLPWVTFLPTKWLWHKWHMIFQLLYSLVHIRVNSHLSAVFVCFLNKDTSISL